MARLKQERVENLGELKNVEDVNTNGSLLDVMNEKPQEPRVIFVLDNAPLHKGLVGKKWKILDSWRDQDFLLKHKKNLKDFRPENVRQPLLDIFDSRVNKAGKVGAVYVKIDDGVLFEIKPHARIPRTYNRFCGLILDLLKKRCIRAEDTNEVLFRVLNEPVSQHSPSNSRIIGVSNGLEKLVDIQNYVSATNDDMNLIFVVSATDHKKINICTDDVISVSHYPLVSMSCVGMICEALEHKWIVEPPSHN